MEKSKLELLLKEGKSHREIASILNMGKSNVGYWVNKLNLTHLNNTKQLTAYNLNKIDSKELAYIIGFLLGDSHLKNDIISVSVALCDIEIVERIQKYFDGNVRVSNKTDKAKKIYPNASFMRKINGIKKIFGGELKDSRNFPIVSKELERFLILGFFDAEGCITWGRRKDRDRVWQKISFTSKLGMLIGVQNFLIKRLNISTIIRPKSNSDCHVLEFSSKSDVLKFCEYIYSDDFNSLNRKREKYEALRLELGEFGGSESYTEPSLQSRKV